MIRTGSRHLENLQSAAGIECSTTQHVEELLLGHETRAREGCEQTAGLQHGERKLVHVEIFFQCGNHLIAITRHLRRVQHDDIIEVTAIGGFAQPRENIRLHKLHRGTIQFRVALGDVQNILIDVDANNFRGTALRRGIDTEATGVATQIQHALATHMT